MRPFFSYGLCRPQTPVFWLNFLLPLSLLLPFLPLHRCRFAFTAGRVLAVDSHRIAPGILRRRMMMFPLLLFLFFSTVGQMHTVRTLSGLLYISSCKKASMYETTPCIKGRLGVKECWWCPSAWYELSLLPCMRTAIRASASWMFCVAAAFIPLLSKKVDG